MRFKGNVYDITSVDRDYIIREFDIIVEDMKIKRVILKDKHPNCNPETNEFCLPTEFEGMNLNPSVIPLIEGLLKIYNLENCFYSPWSKFRWRTRRRDT